jgi:hypothetical protein
MPATAPGAVSDLGAVVEHATKIAANKPSATAPMSRKYLCSFTIASEKSLEALSKRVS